MSKPLSMALLCAVLLAPAPVLANPIERACLQSDRDAANRTLCRCIGYAAERTLSYSQMRTGARFFRDPERAVDMQLSDTRSSENFWRSWREFSDAASRTCG
jgi:hypothetical protein